MATKVLKLNVFSENDVRFTPYTMSVWATKDDIQALLPDGMSPENQPNYVKITSRNPLVKFTFYAKIDIGGAHCVSGHIFVPQRLIHRTWTYDTGMDVDVD